ncbi:MAG: hypothetical protein ACERKO_03275 [Acetanaerobacterium sp.]
MAKDKDSLERLAEEYLGRFGQPNTAQEPRTPDLSGAAAGIAGLVVFGIAHCVQMGDQQDVKRGMPVRFDACESVCEGVRLHENRSKILFDTERDTLFLLWYAACVSPLLGTTASLMAELDGRHLTSGGSFGQSAYQIGVSMTLCANAAFLLPGGEQRVLRIVNNDGDADVSHASALLVGLSAPI